MAHVVEEPSLWLSRVFNARGVLERHIDRTDPYVRAFAGSFPSSLPGSYKRCDTSSNYVYQVTRAITANLPYWFCPLMPFFLRGGASWP